MYNLSLPTFLPSLRDTGQDAEPAWLHRSRAMCHVQILKPQQAVADLKKVLALEPQNAQVRKELESTQKLIRRIEFEKAIEVEEEKSAVERCLEILAEGALCRQYR
jgi:serine/threonine-protein phosphatase 5